MEKLTAKTNTIIKNTKKLLTSSKYRNETSSFVLEGVRLCFDALNSYYKIKTLLVTEECAQKYSDKITLITKRADNAYLITDEIAQKLCDTVSPQGIFCICTYPRENLLVDDEGMYVALDNIQDPSNLGAIIRSAEALGIHGIIVYNCCDIYNPKALRASMGSILRMPVMVSNNLVSDIVLFKADSFKVYGTVPDDTAVKITDVSFSNSVICVIGNEANGITEDVIEACDQLITIPMKGRTESLNASVAASITMWEMMRK